MAPVHPAEVGAPGGIGRPTPVYSPWREDIDTLRGRTVGRASVLEQVASGVERHARGERPLPVYLFGPRGVGKSHLVTLGAAAARASLAGSRIDVRVIGEDIPQPRDAEALWNRMAGGDEIPAWNAWGGPTRPTLPRPSVVFVEGWDRLLEGLDSSGRRALRRRLHEHPEVWLVATGARLGEVLIGREEAFFGAFAPVPLQPLDDADAAELVDGLVGEAARAHPRWPARRDALLTLAGGSPRALIALAEAVAAAPGEEVARRLLDVLDQFTPHYQIRFRDCSGQEQRLVDLLSRAPRELGPTDASLLLGEAPQTWSSVAHRLEEHGVLTIRRDGRNAWYRLTEPLFRHWLEYRSAPAGQSRIAWLGRLLERVLGPDELIAAWTQGEGEVVRSAALDAMGRRSDARQAAWRRILGDVAAAIRGNDPPRVEAAVAAALELRPDAPQAWTLALLLHESPFPAQCARLGAALRREGCPTLATLAAGVAKEVDARRILRDLARSGAEELRRAGAWDDARSAASSRVLPALLDRAIRWKDTRGRSWTIRPDEAVALAAIPGLRYRLYRHGRLPGQPGLLTPAHLDRVALQPTDPDLDRLLWIGVASLRHALSGRVLSLLEEAPEPRLPWCPWPGRLVRVDIDALCRVAARSAGAARLSWSGNLGAASAEAFEAFLASFGATPPPPREATQGHELAFARLKRDAPERFERLARALGDGWAGVCDRAALVLVQLAEARRGPLHPELERIRLVIEDSTPW